MNHFINDYKKNGLVLFTMDVTNNKNNISEWYVDKENFKIIQNKLNKKCDFFAPPQFTVPSNNINWGDNLDKRNFLRKFLSEQYRRVINKIHPNFYIFGGSWIKK